MSLLVYLFSLFLVPPSIRAPNNVWLESKEGFVIITSDSIFYTTDGNQFSRRAHRFGLDMYRMEAVARLDKNHKTFLVASGGGLVYRYDEQLDTVVRLDSSYRFMSRFRDTKMSFKDTIFSFGGYGEFSYDNKLISFKEYYREWNVFPVQGKETVAAMAKNIIQIDSVSGSIYIGLGLSSFFEDGIEITKKHDEIIRINRDFSFERVGSFKGLLENSKFFAKSFLNYKQFNNYRNSMLYSHEGIWTVDLISQKAFKHNKVDPIILQQYTDILAYNTMTNRFLMGTNLGTNDPRFYVINEIDLLGLEYEEYSLAPAKLPNWAYGLFGLSLLLLISLFRTKSFVVLIEAIQSHERRIQQRLSSEDFFILKRIIEAYPEHVEYPELQNSYEKDLSYESRIKKLRASLKEIDYEVQEVIGRKRNSIFEIEKGREDKRVKVIRIKNDQLKKVDLFGRLRRGSK